MLAFSKIKSFHTQQENPVSEDETLPASAGNITHDFYIEYHFFSIDIPLRFHHNKKRIEILQGR